MSNAPIDATKPLRGRARALAAILARAGARPLALKVTADGQPGHPLYIASDTEPRLWEPPSA
ncbi:hypothetical protein EAH89_24525 [Roseomonas nepalensis]|uniref:Uncharacterized protein n=1 Tax=Muricoccus nepalensis TaxID=1854500 RepID=A0A502FAS7_9PROT|nr:hypothetical protein [Roseomonas nepalensis]TPG46480.1 hypothetical protein EAH89_24525 [Roseomonas nepalensis]